MERRRLAVLISGSGSNLQAIIEAVAADRLPAELAIVVSNRGDAYGIERARQAGIDVAVLTPDPDETRPSYDERLAALVNRYSPDLIVLAGWMRILSNKFIEHYPNRIINLHPALPGEYAGLRSIERAFDDARAGRRDHTGAMVHLVPDEGVDDGPVLATTRIAIGPHDTLAMLERRMHHAEHHLLVDTIHAVITAPTFPPTPSKETP